MCRASRTRRPGVHCRTGSTKETTSTAGCIAHQHEVTDPELLDGTATAVSLSTPRRACHIATLHVAQDPCKLRGSHTPVVSGSTVSSAAVSYLHLDPDSGRPPTTTGGVRVVSSDATLPVDAGVEAAAHDAVAGKRRSMSLLTIAKTIL